MHKPRVRKRSEMILISWNLILYSGKSYWTFSGQFEHLTLSVLRCISLYVLQLFIYMHCIWMHFITCPPAVLSSSFFANLNIIAFPLLEILLWYDLLYWGKLILPETKTQQHVSEWDLGFVSQFVFNPEWKKVFRAVLIWTLIRQRNLYWKKE